MSISATPLRRMSFGFASGAEGGGRGLEGVVKEVLLSEKATEPFHPLADFLAIQSSREGPELALGTPNQRNDKSPQRLRCSLLGPESDWS